MIDFQNALVAAQRLEKKLRQLRNRGEATEADVSDAKQAMEILRLLGDRHGWYTPDIDSGAERRRQKRERGD